MCLPSLSTSSYEKISHLLLLAKNIVLTYAIARASFGFCGRVPYWMCLQAERYYKSAHDQKPTALQPYHGLVQLYRRTGAHDKHADALRHVVANTTDKSAKYGTRVELAKALIQSNRLDEASVAIIAIEDDLREGCVNEDEVEVPEEVSMLKADCQLALDEQEYNSRIESTLATRRNIMSNNGEDKRDDDLLIQEVAATWVRCNITPTEGGISFGSPHFRFHIV